MPPSSIPRSPLGLLNPEVGGTVPLSNSGIYFPADITKHPRRLESSKVVAITKFNKCIIKKANKILFYWGTNSM